jgi:hypothetical protein
MDVVLKIGFAAMPAIDSYHSTDTTFGSDTTATIYRNFSECLQLITGP